MRRLQVVACPEAWERMRDDGDGRYCERCRLHVTEVAKLDEEGLERMLSAAERGRVCARFELDGGRPRTRLGIAAGVLVATVSGCAGSLAATPPPEVQRMSEDGSYAVDTTGGVVVVVDVQPSLPTANFVSAPAFDDLE